MTVKLPNEVVLQISTSLGTDSSLDLKPFTLLNRQWHNVVAPILLSTIAVPSLGKLVELCDHILSFSGHTGGTLPSTIETHTKTLVIAGETWDAWKPDSHAGLEDLGEIPRGGNEEDGDPVELDIKMSPEEILTKLRDALPRLVALEGLEWYGRFAGDYYLVRYLQKANVIKHLAYGIDMQSSSPSIAYQQNAFLFEGLKTLSVTTEYEPDPDMFPHTLAMMHKNPDLESILFDCKFAESLSGTWSLTDLICDTSKPEKPIFVWPNLTHLVLRFYKGAFWQEAEEVDRLAKFLVAHPKLETLVLRETCLEDSESETALPLSLSSYPESLSHLKILLGSPRLLAGVLESRAASSSVLSVIDNSEEMFDSDGAKAPYVDRMLAALEKVPDNRVRRLRLEVPQLSKAVYARFARVVPGVRFLEFLEPNDGSRGNTTPQDDSFDLLVDIPASLNEFSQLEIVGEDIIDDFMMKAGGSNEERLLELAKRVPRIKAVHCGEGALLRIRRDSDGNPRLPKEIEYMDNKEYDWDTFSVDWRHRPMSSRAVRKIRDVEHIRGDSLIHLVRG